MRHGTMRTDTIQANFKHISRRHTSTPMHPDSAKINARPVMHTPDGLHVELGEQTIIGHGFGASTFFFGRLENEIDRTVKIPCFGQILRRTQQHRRMAIMPTGMHPTGYLRSMFEFVQFLHWQGIHIGAQANRRMTVTVTTQNTHNTGFAHAAMHLNAKGFELFSNKIRRPDFFIGDFWMRMQKMPPATHVFMSVSNRIYNSHKKLLMSLAGISIG